MNPITIYEKTISAIAVIFLVGTLAFYTQTMSFMAIFEHDLKTITNQMEKISLALQDLNKTLINHEYRITTLESK